jgi:predicted ATPase/DNA-binding SARP family transcriptional activator
VVTTARVEVLGPIRVLDDDGHDVTPSGALQRRLLALLVLRRGRAVSVDAAVDALWPSERPADPTAALQHHVSRLRRAVPALVIDAVDDGYRLDPTTVDVDADRLATAVSDGDDSDALGAVLARWRGPAFPELADVDEARPAAAGLDELRARAREAIAEARLAGGDVDGVVTDLVALVDEHPLRERPRQLLMAVLATSGRQAEALRVYDEFRRTLAIELGIEPSAALAAQHGALLDGTAPAPDRLAVASLPIPATSIIGRDELASTLLTAVASGRLVTLVGPGGVGKTRLLLEVGHRLHAADPDRPVVLCELAAADDVTTADAVAAALGVDARLGTPLATRITDVIGGTEIVLLLDNCEHVLDAAAALAEHVLATCPTTRIVATSRERLRLAGEQVHVVPPLSFADDGDGPAIELFLERARAVAPDLDPDAGDLALIAEIVRRLDGLPLAIELAAARLHTHDLAEVAAGLDQRFALLSAGTRTATRHGSLGAAVAWSYDLLDDELRRTFTDLAVFAGPFDAAAAAAVADVDAMTMAGALTNLVERSLLTRTPRRRYVLLETLRAFGADRLAVEGRLDDLTERHARHFVTWAEEARHRMQRPGEPVLAEIDAAIPELRHALGWLLDHGDVEQAGRLVSALADYAVLRLRPDVLAWAERVTAADPDDRSAYAAEVWVVAAHAAWTAGEVETTGARAARASAVAGPGAPTVVPAMRGHHLLFVGDLTDAVRWYDLATAADDDPATSMMSAASAAMALGYAGDPTAPARADRAIDLVGDVETPYAAYVWYCAGEALLAVDIELARARLAKALELGEQTNAAFVVGIAGASKASIDARIGDPVAAAADYRRLILHWRRAGMWSTQWTMLRSIAGLLARLGRFYDAAVLEAAVRSTSAGHRIFGADEVALAELGSRLRAELGADAYEEARRQGAVLDGAAAVEHALRAL